jgi:predicted transposase YdaD
MYTLLPAMQGATPDLLKQALEEIVHNYSRQQIGSHLLRFHRIMWRSNMMSNQEKLEIEKELHMQYHFDEFIDENPVVLERIARGEARGKIEGLRESTLSILAVRFSALAATPQAQQTIAHIQDIEKLKQLQHEQIAPDEQSARALLNLPVRRDLL